jgi:hypothetical protein
VAGSSGENEVYNKDTGRNGRAILQDKGEINKDSGLVTQ